MTNQPPDRLTRLRAAMRPAGIDVLAVVPGANMRYLPGLEIHMNERIGVAFIAADQNATSAMVLPTLETPRAKAQARFPITFYSWDDADGPADALGRRHRSRRDRHAEQSRAEACRTGPDAR